MDLGYALWGAAAAALALILGAAVAGLRTPSARLQSVMGHLASGVVTGVVAAELVPEILETGRPGALSIGFIAGACLMISVQRISDRYFKAQGNTGFLVATGLDVTIDGLLIGFAFAIGTSVGGLLVLAFILELLALGLAVGSDSANSNTGAGSGNALRKAFILALPVVPAAAAGALLLISAGEGLRQGLMGFAVAVMLYLVTEELMKEAHETEETPVATAAFFFGFLVLVLLELAILH
ncbi:MAG: transporter [Myxococcota bacterium]|nr:transporter [Myxococcota bacterium]